jgi:hypothetical protein
MWQTLMVYELAIPNFSHLTASLSLSLLSSLFLLAEICREVSALREMAGCSGRTVIIAGQSLRLPAICVTGRRDRR